MTTKTSTSTRTRRHGFRFRNDEKKDIISVLVLVLISVWSSPRRTRGSRVKHRVTTVKRYIHFRRHFSRRLFVFFVVIKRDGCVHPRAAWNAQNGVLCESVRRSLRHRIEHDDDASTAFLRFPSSSSSSDFCFPNALCHERERVPRNGRRTPPNVQKPSERTHRSRIIWRLGSSRETDTVMGGRAERCARRSKNWERVHGTLF